MTHYHFKSEDPVELKSESEYLAEVHAAMQLLKKNTLRRAKSKAKSDRQKSFYERNPGLRMKLSMNMKMFWANPRKKKMLLAAKNSPEARKKAVENIKVFYRMHPEYRQEMSERMKILHRNNPDISLKISKSMKDYYKSHPERRKEIGERLKIYRTNPDVIRKRSETMKAVWRRRKKLEKLKLETLHKENG